MRRLDQKKLFPKRKSSGSCVRPRLASRSKSCATDSGEATYYLLRSASRSVRSGRWQLRQSVQACMRALFHRSVDILTAQLSCWTAYLALTWDRYATNRPTKVGLSVMFSVPSIRPSGHREARSRWFPLRPLRRPPMLSLGLQERYRAPSLSVVRALRPAPPSEFSRSF